MHLKVLRLRTHYGVPALKGENTWGAEDPGTELRMLPCGHFVVSKYAKHVLLPGASVVSADVEPGQAPAIPVITLGTPQLIDADPMTFGAKRGPGRPKKEPVQE